MKAASQKLRSVHVPRVGAVQAQPAAQRAKPKKPVKPEKLKLSTTEKNTPEGHKKIAEYNQLIEVYNQDKLALLKWNQENIDRMIDPVQKSLALSMAGRRGNITVESSSDETSPLSGGETDDDSSYASFDPYSWLNDDDDENNEPSSDMGDY